jgi:hypothetical protein
VRWGVKNTPWLDTLFLKTDSLLGYGKQASPEGYWKLEVGHAPQMPAG